MSSDCEENNMEMPQFRLIWSPYAELTEDDLMDKDLQNSLTHLDRPNEQNLTETPNPTHPVQEESNTENASVNPHFDAQYMDMTEHDIEQFIDGQQNKNTLTKTVRDIALLNKFLRAKNEKRELQSIPPVELYPLLANYLLTLRKKDGGEYEPSTLRSIVNRIDRKHKRHKYGHSLAGSTTYQYEAFSFQTYKRIHEIQEEGHRNVASVTNYSTISEKQQKNISSILSNTTDENMVVLYTPHTQYESNLPRRTSTFTGPVATLTISAPAVCQFDHDKLLTSF
ncbi:unnamed protein product [Mytilus edulis]|uniref:Uncharacterized protein n=1 Tax=Mytilus edulis TaxID=6550 RepID=A0A8S3THI9_MYTED|nr:unnamed protein product [Mytilus edulis]